jgi:hypothetical protein
MTTGQEFDLFARRWRVIGAERKRPGARWAETAEAARGLICRQVVSDS